MGVTNSSFTATQSEALGDKVLATSPRQRQLQNHPSIGRGGDVQQGEAVPVFLTLSLSLTGGCSCLGRVPGSPVCPVGVRKHPERSRKTPGVSSGIPLPGSSASLHLFA